jgi:hypothetical protein
MIAGTFLLMMLAIVPIWNAISLLHDFNYVFWAGRHTPTTIVVACIAIILLYAATAGIFFARAHVSVQNEQNLMMIGNIFVTLFGLFLMMASVPLTQQADLTSSNLLRNCDFGDQTHRLYEYSQVLQNIRSTPECRHKPSVEFCEGYQASHPYTDFLKSMENEFRCAGFCYRELPASKKSAPGLIGVDQQVVQGHIDHVTPLSLATGVMAIHQDSTASSDTDLEASATYPPTLFSKANFQASCDGMAARNMKNLAGDIGNQSFFQGIYLVLIAVATGFLNLLGFCARKS